MTPSLRVTALDRAVAFLQTVIESARTNSNPHLPTLTSLAATAMVSRVTMSRAVQIAKKKGAIIAVPGRGITIITTPDPLIFRQQHPQPRTHSERIARQIAIDLSTLQLDPSISLPPAKVLQQRYGASVNTIGKAKSLLRSQGVLTDDFKPNATFIPHTGNTTLVLIAAGTNGVLRAITPRTLDHLRQMELICASWNMRLRIITLDDAQRDFGPGFEREIQQIGQDSTVPGIIVWSIGIGRFEACIPLISRLLLQSKRVSLLDESGGRRTGEFKDPLKRLRLWGMAISPRCSECVARHLVASGHRRIAYITPFAPDHRGDNRLNGLVNGFAQAGMDDAVTPFSFGLSGELVGDDGLTALYNLKHDIDTFRSETGPQSFVGAKLRNPANGNNPVAQRLILARSRLDDFAPDFHSTGMFDAQLSAIHACAEFTAWVTSNDVAAAECKEFLRRQPHGRHPVQVIGFDDSELASHFRFSSYNFNGQAVIRAMAHHAAGNPLPAGPLDRSGAEEIPGFLNIRSGTGVPLSNQPRTY